MATNIRIFDFEFRFIDFIARVINVAQSAPDTRAGNHVSGKLIQSASLFTDCYIELACVESHEAFIDNLKICLKELRQTKAWLQILAKADIIKPAAKLDPLIGENNNLIMIVFKNLEMTVQEIHDEG